MAAIAGAAAILIGLVALLDFGGPEPIGIGPERTTSGSRSTQGISPSRTPDASREAGGAGNSGGPARADTVQTPNDSKPPDTESERGRLLLVSAQTDKEIYELGEPVRIHRVYRNPAPMAVRVKAEAWRKPPFSWFSVFSSKGSGGYGIPSTRAGEIEVQPGRTLEDQAIVELAEPGEYTIEAPPEYLARLGFGGPFRMKVSVVDRGNPVPLDAQAERIARKIVLEEPGFPDGWSQAHKDLEAMGSRAVPHLRRWLRESESPHLRAVSAKLLWFVKGREGIEELVGGLKDPDANVRRMCLEGLGRFKEPWTLTAVLPMIEDPDLFVRGEAVSAIGEFEDSRVVPALKTALADADGWVRSGAAVRLADRSDPSGIGVLIEVLRGNPADEPHRVVPALDKITGLSFGKAVFLAVCSDMDRIEKAAQSNREVSAKWLAWWEKTGQAQFGGK